MTKLFKLGVIASCCLLLLNACRKNAVPIATSELTEVQKSQLVATVRADTLFKEFRENQKKGFELMKVAVQSGNIDTMRLKNMKNTGNENDLVNGLKDAGMLSAEAFHAINKRNSEILKELWRKYPGLATLSPDDLIELGKKNPVTKQKLQP